MAFATTASSSKSIHMMMDQETYDAAAPLLPQNRPLTTATTTSTTNVWNEYPGLRRTAMTAPPFTNRSGANPSTNDLVFFPTGGNALQAFPRDVVMRNNNSHTSIISVVVPVGCEPGRTLLVHVPGNADCHPNDPYREAPTPTKWVSITIPPGAHAGHVMLVEVPSTPPPSVHHYNTTRCATEDDDKGDSNDGRSVVVMGEPVEQGHVVLGTDHPATNTEQQQQPNDLILREEVSSETVTTSNTAASTANQKKQDDQNSHHHFVV